MHVQTTSLEDRRLSRPQRRSGGGDEQRILLLGIKLRSHRPSHNRYTDWAIAVNRNQSTKFKEENNQYIFRMRPSWLTSTGCFKKSFTTLKAYRNLYRGHTQRFELLKCSKTHRVLPRIVIRNGFDLFFRFLLHGTSTVTVHRPGKRALRYSRTSPR
jgi:hypothetical protein